MYLYVNTFLLIRERQKSKHDINYLNEILIMTITYSRTFFSLPLKPFALVAHFSADTPVLCGLTQGSTLCQVVDFRT